MKKVLRRFKKHSLHILIILILGLFVGSVAVGVFIQHNPLIRSFDALGYQFITKGPHPTWLNALIKPFDKNFLPFGDMPSYYYPIITFSLIYIFIFKRHMFLWALGCFIFGTFFTGLVTTLDWHFVFRERPFVSLPSNVDPVSRSIWESWSSYPSGHTRETTLYLTIATNFIPYLKWPAIFFCLFIAYSRIYIGAHYPTDVIAGLAIGYMSARITLILARELQILIFGKRGSTHGSEPKENS